MFKEIKNRIAVVKLLHISLNDGWRLMDVLYVLTGKI